MAAMITLRQIEALHWIVKLRTFERAATKLNTTQSAISKRIQELEAAVGVRVFDRSHRTANLTKKGEHLFALAQEILQLQERVFELKYTQEMPARRLRLGVTELSALTWLPRLIGALRDTYPLVTIEPEVNMSRDLYDRLHEDKLDIIIIPDAFSDPLVTSLQLSKVKNVWMASPKLIKTRHTLSLQELANYPILIQGNRSGSGVHLNRWLKSEGATLPRQFSCDSLIALLGLAVAGFGLTYLPKDCFKPLIKEGKLKIITTRPALPEIAYVAMYRNDRPVAFTSMVAQLARAACDFSSQLQGRRRQTRE
jgi:DNA-binding transcriptional LysR family regulator